MRPQRQRLHLFAALFAGIALGPRAIAALSGEGEKSQVIKMTARRFVYTPREIEVQAGVPVVLEIMSIDFFHGFNIPDLKLRSDLPPGQITRVRFTPEKPGVLQFLCDNFCGDGHEEMNGRIVVRA